MLACVDREDPLAESVIKPDAGAIKRRRLGAKPWRAHEESATEPERVSHTPRGGSVALAARIALIPFVFQPIHDEAYRIQSPVDAERFSRRRAISRVPLAFVPYLPQHQDADG